MLGVSQSTVSRAFSSTASISEKKRQMVKDAAAKLGYSPNAIARSLISNRTGLIAIALDYESNPMYDLQVRALSKEIQNRNGQVILSPIQENDLDSAINRAIEYQVDGLIIATSRLTSHAFAQCEKFGIHLCLINRYVEGINANSVGVDNLLAGQNAANFLLSKGYKNMVYISGEPGAMTSDLRWKGFSEQLAKQAVSPPVYINAKYNFQSGFDAAKQVLQLPHVDAIFCANDILAMGVMDGVRESGASIPQDYGIIAVDDIPMSSWPSYNLTTIKQPVELISKRAVDDLMDRINHDADAEGKYILEQGELIIRGSTR
ncbi:substrate-binding domain-containing protein [Vibrio sp. SS-MA-C1-2]|nr:substrate-binding domain-containing protein [Vibrio sp. SS-MA-C1-2]